MFNRCTPVDISCYAKFAEAVVTFVSDNSVLHRLIAGVAASKEIIIGLCVLALGENLSYVLWYGTSLCGLNSDLCLTVSPLHDPHGDNSLHLSRPCVDPHRDGRPGIPR